MNEKTKKEIISWIKSIAVALILAFVIRQYILTPVIVSGQSMEPTFEENNRIIITKINKINKINRFDMVVFHAPNSEDDYIKRVIGLPGDIVVMKNDKLSINGVEYKEEYVQSNKETIFKGQKLTQDFEVEVPEGYLYVLGDNRRDSTDSRALGFIDRKAVVGKVTFRYYPLQDIGIPK